MLVCPSAIASAVARSVSQWSTAIRLISHMVAARLPPEQWMNAGSAPLEVIASRNWRAASGSGVLPLNGTWKYLRPAALAAAVSFDLRTLLVSEPEIDDGDEPHLLDCGNRL